MPAVEKIRPDFDLHEATSNKPTWIYQAFGEPGLLYVGLTTNPKQRMLAHRRSAAWWQDTTRIRWEGPMERQVGVHREYALINTEAPLHNRAGNYKRGWSPTKTPQRAPSRLRELRTGAGITYVQLAERMGVDIATISRWENQRTGIPDKSKIQLGAIFDVSPAELLRLERRAA